MGGLDARDLLPLRIGSMNIEWLDDVLSGNTRFPCRALSRRDADVYTPFSLFLSL